MNLRHLRQEALRRTLTKLDPWKYLVWIFEELPKVKVSKSTFASYTPAAYAQKLHAESRALKVS